MLATIVLFFSITYRVILRGNIRKYGEIIEAMVVRTRKGVNSRGVAFFYPIVSYSVDGQEYEVKVYATTHYEEKFKTGDVVIIAYDKKNPRKAVLHRDKAIYIYMGTITPFNDRYHYRLQHNSEFYLI